MGTDGQKSLPQEMTCKWRREGRGVSTSLEKAVWEEPAMFQELGEFNLC